MHVLAGKGQTQEDFMLKDTCITVDQNDNVVGSESKKACHRFEHATPDGLLHRAFSVFLFDSSGKLLLQRRAACKVTFPQVHLFA